MPVPVRWRYKLDRWRAQIAAAFRPQPKQTRGPQLCPSCGMLAGSTSTRCHQCGTNLSYSVAAASRSLGRYVPQTAAVTYGFLTLCCVLYGVSFLATMNYSGFGSPRGGLFNLGGINSQILARMGASLPWQYELQQPWRLVTAIFLHGSLLHIGFNLWVLMSLAPMLEEMYGSARFFFILIATGACGYLASSAFGHFSVGASGSLLGLFGALLAITSGRGSIGARAVRSQLLNQLVYIAIMSLLPGIDLLAHVGGFASGFLLGKVMTGRPPADHSERRQAMALGWTTGLTVVAAFAFMLLNYFDSAFGGG